MTPDTLLRRHDGRLEYKGNPITIRPFGEESGQARKAEANNTEQRPLFEVLREQHKAAQEALAAKAARVIARERAEQI